MFMGVAVAVLLRGGESVSSSESSMSIVKEEKQRGSRGAVTDANIPAGFERSPPCMLIMLYPRVCGLMRSGVKDDVIRSDKARRVKRNLLPPLPLVTTDEPEAAIIFLTNNIIVTIMSAALFWAFDLQCVRLVQLKI